jgi:hypothetical protein
MAKRWFPTPFWLCQLIHFFVATTVVFATYSFGYPVLWGAGLILLLGLVKELTFDPIVEGNAFFWNGVEDMAFYILGCSVALISLSVTGHI